MTSTSMSSKKKCFLPILWSMKKAGGSCGQAKRQDHPYPLPPHLLHRTEHKQSNPLKQHLYPTNHLHQKLNAVNSPSCSAILSILRSSPASSIRKSIVRWSGRINESVQKLSRDSMGTSLNSLGMDSWCTLAIPRHMKMTPKEQYEPVWVFSLRWKTSIPVCNRKKAFNS